MKKVGILTYHHAINYGANLQAYALWKTLKNHDYEVEIIDYRPAKAIKQYFFGSNFLSHLIKAPKVENFLTNKTKLSKPTVYTRSNLLKQNFDYDVLITGSDEVWNINSFRGFDPAYFLDFMSQSRISKISYAASFGSTTTLGSYQEEIKKLIQQFDYVSVRDSNSLNIIQEECKSKAIQVFDPTLILDDYSEITSNIKYDKKYLLIYGYILNSLEENLVKSLAKLKNLSIISVGCNNKFADKNIVVASIGDWLGYYKQASYVVTSFYHGAIFAVIFRKQFTVLERGNKSIKVNDLLESIGLENRVFSSGNANVNEFIEKNSEIDYSSKIDKLSAGISLSKTFILEAVNG
ncbi:Polysaccharide pyruvyl transferase [Nostoc sp. PCC 7524]|uniref:polysaccharide pyruvyl transferase family protein n=1 Tax=Nostoc sp. (strain ATCC 29411 / PCC 7524) TaxID=28072 RepID=UPI00029F47CB|nr:polysaccharide pyruvyl transferase family protein [Nostoc sp. PCC 7524]AFY50747.1 Polysaccharide pyruvyl transferase [Nostoc sp. PCC 7524]